MKSFTQKSFYMSNNNNNNNKIEQIDRPIS